MVAEWLFFFNLDIFTTKNRPTNSLDCLAFFKAFWRPHPILSPSDIVFRVLTCQQFTPLNIGTQWPPLDFNGDKMSVPFRLKVLFFDGHQ